MSTRRTAVGFVTVMGGSLQASIPGTSWYFSIRRGDFSPHDAFYEFHERDVAPEDVKRFAPNATSLQWRRLPETMLTPMECVAHDGEFRVNLVGQAGKISEAAMIQEFRDFITQSR